MNSNPWAVVQRLIDKALASHCPYGIDDVYVTFSNTEPTSRWPGTSWERITDCFLRAADDKHPAGTTGGAWTHTQTQAEMPKHNHRIANTGSGTSVTVWSPGLYIKKVDTNSFGTVDKDTTMGNGWYIGETGNGKAMDITNKYTAAYMWRRTA